MRSVILYFSGTGNSRYAAETIGAVTGDRVVSMNGLLKSGNREPLRSDRPFVFVCPIYASRIPKVVENFIKETPFEGNRKAYFVLTCGEGAENTIHYIKRLCREKEFVLQGLAAVVMPINHIVLLEAPEKARADEMIKNAAVQLRGIAERIKGGQALPGEKVTPAGIFKSSVINWAFYLAFVSAKGFYATDHCIGCGQCRGLCPLNNIEIVYGKPQWGQNCTHCMACICRCPKEAIEYRNRTEGKRRYYNAGIPK